MTAPSYHDLFVTMFRTPRTSIFDLPFALDVRCNRVTGWQVWDTTPGHERIVAKEYPGADLELGLLLDVAGHVIVDSLTKEK